MEINNPSVVSELTSRHHEYEQALDNNDVEALHGFFWDSPHAVRFGVGENLYGNTEIDAFRQSKPAINLAREVFRVQIVTFGEDTGVVTLEFRRVVSGTVRHGRQTQFWLKFSDGWKVVSAHASFLPLSTAEAYTDLAANLIGLPIPAAFRDGVVQELTRSAGIASLLFEFKLPESAGSAPIFQP